MQNYQNFDADWLLIANGEPLSYQKLQDLSANKKIMVLDGAYEHAKQAGLKIDVLLGDFDSINPEHLIQARENLNHLVIDAPDQNKTDLEKGLEYINTQKPKSIVIAAGAGRRLQHTIYNLRVLKKYHDKNRPMSLLTESELINFYENINIKISGKIGQSIGILGFPYAWISTSGLKYEVKNYALDFDQSSSVLNELAQEEAEILIKGEALIILENP